MHFTNTKCEFYPCHTIDGELNCLFCYCPLMFVDCEDVGTPKYLGPNKTIKDCSDCTFNHRIENYHKMMSKCRQLIFGEEI